MTKHANFRGNLFSFSRYKTTQWNIENMKCRQLTCFWLWCLCVQRLEEGCFGVRFQVSLQARLTLFQSLFVCCPSLGFFGFSITALTVILCGAKSWTSLAPIQTSLAPIWTKGWTVIAGLAEKFFFMCWHQTSTGSWCFPGGHFQPNTNYSDVDMDSLLWTC